MITFKELELSDDMLRAVEKMGFEKATGVQAKTIPIIREGVDILAQSQTGTGKTMAFAIPCVERIDENIQSIQALILSPTRELAQQCAGEIRKLTKYMPHIKIADIFGGADYKAQFKALRTANIVIGTPGRIMDHMKRGTLKLNNLRMIILDEADEMLNMGFKEDIETILKDAPSERQTLLFSATIPKGILEITNEFQNNATRINLVKDKATLAAIRQVFVQIPKAYKNEALKLLIHYHKPQCSIIFANTKSMVDELTKVLCDFGISARGLHGDMRQNQRSAVMADFKSGKSHILIATDVAARGIDVNDVDFVYNYDIPKISEHYVHRIGRTGRAGKSGTAVTLCCGKQQFATLRDFARRLNCEMEEIDVPTVESIKTTDIQRDIEKAEAALAAEASRSAHEIVSELESRGYTHEQIAVCFAGIAFDKKTPKLFNLPAFKKSTEPKYKEVRAKKGTDEKHNYGMLKLDVGYSSKCSANHIVGAITERTGITSKLIGKISISDDFALVEVPSELIENINADLQNLKICGKPVSVKIMKAAKGWGKGAKQHGAHKHKRSGAKHEGHDKKHARGKHGKKHKKD